MRRTIRLLARALPIALALGACGDEPTTIESTSFASSLGVNLAASTKTADGVYYRDLTVGTGTAATTGKKVSVTYTGWLPNGKEFDTGAVSMTIGAHDVVPGFEEGVTGMHAGGTRQIIIPPALAYGSNPPPNSGIPKNAILVFNVTANTVQ